MKPLHELTQIGRGRRLRPVAESLLDAYDFNPTRLKQMTEASNTIFRVSTEDSGPFVLRMTAPKSCHGPDEIRSEVAWLHALDEETDIGVPAPVARRDGEYVTEVDAPGAAEPISCAVYRWVPGVMLDDRLTEPNVRRLGMLMAQLHAHSATFKPPKSFRIRTFDTPFPYANESFPNVEPVVLLDEREDVPLTPNQRTTYRQTHQAVSDEINRLMSREHPLRVLHGDLHMWNVKVHGERLYALDFEDMIWGHPIQDIATTMYYFRWRDDYERMLSAFQSGYEQIAPWPEAHPRQLDTLIMGRALLLANYICVSEDSEDRAFAPEYLTRVERRLREFLDS